MDRPTSRARPRLLSAQGALNPDGSKPGSRQGLHRGVAIALSEAVYGARSDVSASHALGVLVQRNDGGAFLVLVAPVGL